MQYSRNGGVHTTYYNYSLPNSDVTPPITTQPGKIVGTEKVDERIEYVTLTIVLHG